MATPRKKNKIRDYDRTRQRLLEVVGEILRETGYTGLKTNNIARKAGKDKNLIRYYFQSLINLEKTYIKENDYWFAFFERFSISEQPQGEELKQFFITLMKENFNFFRENIEMQKIILWQISENNPLMRSVSDQREVEGNKLLKLTDPYLKEFDVNFRAVIGIVLGASYYLVLHGESNKSTVCGLDINIEKDRSEVLKTMEQFINWAWEKRNVPQICDFDNNTVFPEKALSYLRQFCLEEDFCDLDVTVDKKIQYARNKISLFILSADNESKKQDNISLILKELTLISNNFYFKKQLKSCDLICDIISDIIDSFRSYISERLLLPIKFNKSAELSFSSIWQPIISNIKLHIDDQTLIELINMPLLRFRKNLAENRWSDHCYLESFIESVGNYSKMKSLNIDDLFIVILSSGFNHSRFTSWGITNIQSKIIGMNSSDAIIYLGRIRNRLNGLTLNTHRNFQPQNTTTTEELNRWITEEFDLLRLRNDAGHNELKLRSKLKFLQLSYWEKLQLKHGFYEEANLEVFSSKIINNFCNADKDVFLSDECQDDQFQDRASLKPIEEMLSKMLEEVRNYLSY